MHKILFVDDDAILCMTATAFFSAKGVQVKTASCGEDALKELEKTRFDLIILDVLMPGTNGFEVCKDIKRLCNRALMNSIVSEKEMILIATGNNYQIRQHIIGQNRERQLIMQKEVPFFVTKS